MAENCVMHKYLLILLASTAYFSLLITVADKSLFTFLILTNGHELPKNFA